MFPCLHHKAVKVLYYEFDLTLLMSIFLVEVADSVSTCHQFRPVLLAPYLVTPL
jgi:hypothetical protein